MSTQSSHDEVRRLGVREGAARSLAQTIALLGGLGLIAIGVLGFIFGGSDFGTGDAVQGETFLIFEVNGWHNVVHIVTGAFLVLVSLGAASAIFGLLAFGLVYAGVTVWGFIDGNDVANLIAIDADDNWLHLALSVGALLFGLIAGGFGASALRQRKRIENEPAGRRTDRFDRNQPQPAADEERERAKRR